MFAVQKCLTLPKMTNLLSFTRNGGSIPIILLDKLENKGKKGEIIKVKRGYARNFLIPKKMAAYATQENRLKYASLVAAVSDYNKEVLLSLKDVPLRFERASTSGGNLFGSVTINDIAKHFHDMAVTANNISVENSVIKTLGLHVAVVDGVEFKIEVVEPALISKAL